MQVRDIVVEIDNEIARLQQARALLAGEPARKTTARKKATATAAKPGPRKRKLSPEGRRRIAEAMKRRWAERKKQSAAKATK